MADLEPGRYDFTATAMADGLQLLAGGRDDYWNAQSLCQALDLDTLQTSSISSSGLLGWWRKDLALPGPRGGHAAVRLPNGEIVLLGNDWLSRAQTAYRNAQAACENEHGNYQYLAGQDWDAETARVRSTILRRISDTLGREIEPLIATEQIMRWRRSMSGRFQMAP